MFQMVSCRTGSDLSGTSASDSDWPFTHLISCSFHFEHLMALLNYFPNFCLWPKISSRIELGDFLKIIYLFIFYSCNSIIAITELLILQPLFFSVVYRGKLTAYFKWFIGFCFCWFNLNAFTNWGHRRLVGIAGLHQSLFTGQTARCS